MGGKGKENGRRGKEKVKENGMEMKAEGLSAERSVEGTRGEEVDGGPRCNVGALYTPANIWGPLCALRG